MQKHTNILFIGDVVGKPGRKAIGKYLPLLKEKYQIDFTVINAENSAGGFGLTQKVAKELFECGADVLTMGDHTWDKAIEIDEIFSTSNKVLRPYNYPKNLTGKGFEIYTLANGIRIAVLNMLGRTFMSTVVDCPFAASRELQRQYRMGEDYDIMIIDNHVEASSEAVCLGELWDGKASLIGGSHTHIPTADAYIKPRGTLYQTDTGMTGVYNTSLGCEFAGPIKQFETGIRQKKTIATGDATLCALYAKVDNTTGKTVEFKMIRTGGCLPDTEI